MLQHRSPGENAPRTLQADLGSKTSLGEEPSQQPDAWGEIVEPDTPRPSPPDQPAVVTYRYLTPFRSMLLRSLKFYPFLLLILISTRPILFPYPPVRYSCS